MGQSRGHRAEHRVDVEAPDLTHHAASTHRTVADTGLGTVGAAHSGYPHGMATLRLPFEDEDTGLLHRVYEKDVDLSGVPSRGDRIPGLEVGYPLTVERIDDQHDQLVVWLSPVSGFSRMTFGQQTRLDFRLSASGWRRAYRPRP